MSNFVKIFMKATLKWFYKVMRSILFTAIIVVVTIFAIIYIALLLPPVQDRIKEIAAEQLALFLDSKVEVGNLSIIPLNEIIVNEAVVYDQSNEKCLDIGRLGAGINLWRLIFGGEIEITHVELVDFKGNVYQQSPDEPLNIDFIIKAFEPKDKNKPPTLFDLKIHNVVLRKGDLIFEKRWQKKKSGKIFDVNHLEIENLSADVTLPRVTNDDIEIDLRRLSFIEKSGLQINDLGGYIKVTPDEIRISDLKVELPSSNLNFNNFTIPKSFFSQGEKKGKDEDEISIKLYDSKINPSNFSAFYPPLSLLDISVPLKLELKGNTNRIDISEFEIELGNKLKIDLSARINNFLQKENLKVNVDNLQLLLTPDISGFIDLLLPNFKKSDLFDMILRKAGNIFLDFRGGYDATKGDVEAIGKLQSQLINMGLTAQGSLKENVFDVQMNLETSRLELSDFIANSPVTELSNTSVELGGKLNLKNLEESDGYVNFSLGEISLFERSLSNIKGDLKKSRKNYDIALDIDDNNLNGSLRGSAELAGADSRWHLWAELSDFDTYNSLLTTASYGMGYEISGVIEAEAKGNNFDNVTGNLEVSGLSIKKPTGEELDFHHLTFNISNNEEDIKNISLRSEIADFDFAGKYKLALIPPMIRKTLGEVCPSLFPAYAGDADCGYAAFNLNIKDAGPLIEFFKIPVIPLTALNINGNLDSDGNRINLSTDIPYIQQGKNKLITDTYLKVDLIGETGEANVSLGTVYPTKKGLLKMDLDLVGHHGDYNLNIGLNRGRDVMFFGEAPIKLLIDKDPENGELSLIARWLPGELHINDLLWSIEESEMKYNRDGLYVQDFCIRHADQFIFISGENTKEGEGELMVTLSDINLDYIFELLNIPNVTFGGNATGGALARGIFTKDPDIHTEGLVIKNLSYNGAVLGDGDVSGRLDMKEKMVAIGARVKEGEKLVADVDGGVWFGRDSLSFAFDADGVNIGFMQPFMAAFSSDVKGRASGKALLYGTFSDIDMKGTIVAQEATIKIDYINTAYTGSDTVYMKPGIIELPNFTVKDKFGNTALLNGELKHRQFHDPVFKFNLSDMQHLLVYDTNSKINSRWYGKIYASGAGEINGKPGVVNIMADVQTEKGSDFTFVLSDQQEAVKSHFLTFTDKRKEALAVKVEELDTIPDFLKKFYTEQKKQEEVKNSVYSMDFRVSVTPEIKFNLIMDPVGGDKITAWGDGAMNLTYSSLTDELKIYGKYILEKGNYNFTLQDIILKDFTIKPGSSIAFTGNPYNGILDITAAYKVNTSLTELDQSFANDRELNRTSVPVEALLKVTGQLTSPQIGFDIDLPTVTEETAQKVRSIISTDDMMSRQVLFLVALNKFYPPEYMSTTNSGGEWASIASSTLSSQIQNAIGQITDKFTLAPSIRSDKGDFSDIEVDVALSSQLFNNRLLINGNLGYRDPSNSSTMFVGDFDLEYLLTKSGNWRLKAYNHFNDQNYYLKSALTTQGIGIVWKKEFGKPLINKTQATKKDEEEEEIKEVEIIETP